MKECQKCHELKDESLFHKKLGGLASRCKPCAKEISTAWRLANRERVLARRRQQYTKNPEKKKASVKRWNDSNRVRRSAAGAKWREANKEKLKARQRGNRDHINAVRREWIENGGRDNLREINKRSARKNASVIKARQAAMRADPAYKEKRRAYMLEYQRKRRKEPLFNAVKNLRRRILNFIHGKDKSAKSMELLGCDLVGLKAHLEGLFRDGMTWENYGLKGWHIDHKVLCGSFDLLDPAQQRACFHFTNLQPLWWHENLTKGDSVCP